jgi:hypothetical protein
MPRQRFLAPSPAAREDSGYFPPDRPPSGMRGIQDTTFRMPRSRPIFASTGGSGVGSPAGGAACAMGDARRLLRWRGSARAWRPGRTTGRRGSRPAARRRRASERRPGNAPGTGPRRNRRRTEMMPPPEMAMHIRPDVAEAGAVERSSVRVKMVGNMIELNRPIRIAANPGRKPVVSGAMVDAGKGRDREGAAAAALRACERWR